MNFPPRKCYETWPPQWPEIHELAGKCMHSGAWGRYRSDFHDELVMDLRHRFDGATARLCSSGTAAIELCLRAAGIGRGDEVIIAAFDYPGNFRCVELAGATPVLVDVEVNSPTLRVDQLEEVASDRTRAVIVSHLYGHQARMDEIAAVAKQHDWVVIEDACQAIGASRGQIDVGTIGDLTALSFGGGKLTTAGAGGAIVTSSQRLSARLSTIIERPSNAYPISSLQCAVLIPQLRRLDEMNWIRRETVDFLAKLFATRLSRWTLLASEAEETSPAYYKLAILVDSAAQRDLAVELGKSIGLPIGPGFRSMHRVSSKRCRRAPILDQSAEFGDRLMVLDHRALLIPSNHRETLASDLCELHDRTGSGD